MRGGGALPGLHAILAQGPHIGIVLEWTSLRISAAAFHRRFLYSGVMDWATSDYAGAYAGTLQTRSNEDGLYLDGESTEYCGSRSGECGTRPCRPPHEKYHSSDRFAERCDRDRERCPCAKCCELREFQAYREFRSYYATRPQVERFGNRTPISEQEWRRNTEHFPQYAGLLPQYARLPPQYAGLPPQYAAAPAFAAPAVAAPTVAAPAAVAPVPVTLTSSSGCGCDSMRSMKIVLVFIILMLAVMTMSYASRLDTISEHYEAPRETLPNSNG
jgi:hypothetical protein